HEHYKPESIQPPSKRSHFTSTYMSLLFLFFFNDPAPTEIYTLSLHDALPISARACRRRWSADVLAACALSLWEAARSEEHTSELQSLAYLVCRLLLEKKK